jgi:UV DNA damage endonuclease
MRKIKIGYPCINLGIGCTPNTTFRLKSYSKRLLKEKIESNLKCLRKTLGFGIENDLLFFRIGSGLIPFASHSINKFNWAKEYKKDFEEIGELIKKNKMRISMHPDQFVVLNSLSKDIVGKSVAEVEYHCKVLDLMGLGPDAKVQIHVGGVYGDKEKAMQRFVKTYNNLKKKVRKRLVIENDDKLYSLKDCMGIHKETGVPILFDVFHHDCLNNGESVSSAMKTAAKTWSKKDGFLMVDYSSQKCNARKGSHTESIDLKNFKKFFDNVKGMKFDIILEIKDKEKSALEALECLRC